MKPRLNKETLIFFVLFLDSKYTLKMGLLNTGHVPQGELRESFTRGTPDFRPRPCAETGTHGATAPALAEACHRANHDLGLDEKESFAWRGHEESHQKDDPRSFFGARNILINPHFGRIPTPSPPANPSVSSKGLKATGSNLGLDSCDAWPRSAWQVQLHCSNRLNPGSRVENS